MSKSTLAIVAAGSALAGAATTLLLYPSRPRPLPTLSPPSPTQSLTTSKVSLSSPPFPSTATATAPISPVDPSGLFAYGFPGPISDLRTASSLVSSYDRRTRNPAWVAEHITPASLALRSGDRRHSIFSEDHSIPEMFRAKLADYFKSGFDRGHQVPAADAKWSQNAMDATFSLSNVCPQVGDGFNRDYWAHLEDFCRRLTGRYSSVRIVTGPLYLPKRVDGMWKVEYQVIGNPPNVAVPTHFFKVVYGEDAQRVGEKSVALAAFVLPNAPIANNKPLKEFEVPVEIVER